jgi:hypothetical protein
MRRGGWMTIAACATLIAMPGCGRRAETPATSAPLELPIRVLADTGRSGRLAIALPDTGLGAQPTVWLARVSPTRAPMSAPLPEPVPGPPAEDALAPAPPRLEVDEDLKPPIPRERTPLVVPDGARGIVELDVRVDESGAVSDALWAGGSEDSSLVDAAITCALTMRFYPALKAGRPVAVWCRERFEFPGR